MATTHLFGYKGRRVSLDEMRSRPTIARLDPELWRRLVALMRAAAAAGVDLGVGEGWRSSDTQTAGFLARHDAVESGGCCEFNGQRYQLKTGQAHMAPPGRSYHEETTPDGCALAVDMVGDLAWMNANCARFGLTHFADVNSEPWHVQPVDVPSGRRRYSAATHHPLPVFALPDEPVVASTVAPASTPAAVSPADRVVQPGQAVADYGTPMNAATVAGYGYVAVGRYIDGTASTGQPSWKALTRTERDRLWEAGLGILLIWEQKTGNWRGGEQRGVADGRRAAREAEFLGYPATLPIIVTYDEDVTAADRDTVLAYWNGFQAGAAGRALGVYGDRDVLDMVADAGCVLFCQAAASSWSGRTVSPHTHLLQRVDKARRLDHNEVLRPVAVWGPRAATAATVDPDRLEAATRQRLRLGARGDAVVVLQLLLTAAGFPVKADGWWGPATDRAVRAFQRTNIARCRVVDGLVGPLTWAALTAR